MKPTDSLAGQKTKFRNLEEITMTIRVTRRTALTWAAGSLTCLVMPGVSLGQSAAKRATLLMGAPGPRLSLAPSYIAELLGFYKEEGLEVSRIFMRSGPAGMTALVSGSGDAYYTAPGEMIAAAARGQKFKIVMAQSSAHTLYLVLTKGYAAKFGLTENMPYEEKRKIAAANFKGIRCGVTSPGSITDGFARQVISSLGLNPAKDAQIVPTQSTENAVSAAANGAIDAFVALPPNVDQAVAEIGAVPIFSVTKDEVPGFKSLGGFVIEARASDVESNPELFQALVNAEVRGLRYIIEKSEEAASIIYKAQYASMMSPDTWRTMWTKNFPQFQSPYFTKESIEAWISLGMVPNVTDLKSIDAASLVDMRFVDKAVQQIGWKVPT
ncbi:ABC transporter substrate-binding protein [Microvirga sp. M8]|uniref:ABC transporter substrate-binding protein n=1 Tax=Microvirga tunisiensis TaxID=2108360 RepID=UPI00128CA839|nr:ABC transporter substrate-binding protein [Microvirga tunisiensis]MPR05444.1 ABC transporter substrate-binding protein [Microvirga tunisiensis]